MIILLFILEDLKISFLLHISFWGRHAVAESAGLLGHPTRPWSGWLNRSKEDVVKTDLRSTC